MARQGLHDAGVDYRAHPECYRIGRGEQGVFRVEPYKSELLPHWRFKDPQAARESVARLEACFADYQAAEDFVGMDMARKFLQMGYTRARRHARHRSGRKFNDRRGERPIETDADKAEVARLFHAAWTRVREDPAYRRAKRCHQRHSKCTNSLR